MRRKSSKELDFLNKMRNIVKREFHSRSKFAQGLWMPIPSLKGEGPW